MSSANEIKSQDLGLNADNFLAQIQAEEGHGTNQGGQLSHRSSLDPQSYGNESIAEDPCFEKIGATDLLRQEHGSMSSEEGKKSPCIDAGSIDDLLDTSKVEKLSVEPSGGEESSPTMGTIPHLNVSEIILLTFC